MGDGFKEHGLMLYLSPQLYLGFIQLQADKKLGRSYAGLLAFVEGMHSLGYLKDDDYADLKKRYSRSIVPEEKPLSMEQLQTKREQNEKSKVFSMVLDQWHLHKDPKWRSRWIAEAEVWKGTVQNAKLICDLAETEQK